MYYVQTNGVPQDGTNVPYSSSFVNLSMNKAAGEFSATHADWKLKRKEKGTIRHTTR